MKSRANCLDGFTISSFTKQVEDTTPAGATRFTQVCAAGELRAGRVGFNDPRNKKGLRRERAGGMNIRGSYDLIRKQATVRARAR
jgi:hypothetical protein